MKTGQRSSRWIIASLVAVLAVFYAGCTPGDTTSTTTSEASTTTTSDNGTPTTTQPADPALAEPLPTDPEIVTGTLQNGLTYYIRYNDSPGDRAELRLAVDAGSLHEDDDQAGGAHFLEHMMFNGTTRFPKNELTEVLEAFGPQFGPDINAYTSFEETVYLLSLEANDDLLDLGVEVLREWATEATLTEQDVVDERGVVLEEWRLRDEGLAGRVNELVQDLFLPGTTYEGHAPIGTEESISTMTPEVLDRFYGDWYRTDTMAVIAVGDFDVEEMEERIIEQFSSMPATTDTRTSPQGTAPTSTTPKAGTLADPEVALVAVDVTWPTPAGPVETVGNRQDLYVHAAALNMIATRLNDDALRGEAPLLSATNSTTGFTRAFSLSALSVEARPEETRAALEAVHFELARVVEHGFSDDEFTRAMEELTAAVEIEFESSDTAQDVTFAATLVEHYLAGQEAMSPQQRFDVDSGILERITKGLVEDSFRSFLAEQVPHVIVVAPDNATDIPSSEEIESLFASAPEGPIEPRPEVAPIESLMRPPAFVAANDAVVDEELGFVTLTFDNGATVMAWPTTIAEGIVTASVESFGGTSKVPVEDVTEAELITEMVSRSGIGDADAASLDRFLADRVVSAFPWISETREGIFGTSSSDDLEVMLQMIHLLMTEPRVDSVSVDAVLAEYKALDASREDTPALVIDDAVHDMYYSGNPRYHAIPTAEQLETFDAVRAEEIYRERFADAGDFVFAFVGDFDPQELGELVARYVGSLPGEGVRETWTDNQPLPPREIQLRTVQAGTDPQGEVQQYWTNVLDPSHKDRLTGRVMELIVNARLRDRIREELSASYSPSAFVSLQRDPDPFIETNVQVTGDPERLEEISNEVLADLDDLARNGPTESEFETAVQQVRTEMELINNPQLADALTNSYLYPDEPVSQLLERYTLIDEVTANDVRRMAALAYNPNQRIEVRLVPLD